MKGLTFNTIERHYGKEEDMKIFGIFGKISFLTVSLYRTVTKVCCFKILRNFFLHNNYEVLNYKKDIFNMLISLVRDTKVKKACKKAFLGTFYTQDILTSQSSIHNILIFFFMGLSRECCQLFFTKSIP